MKIAVPLKCLINFWITLDMPLINYQVNLTITWSENCDLTDMKTQAAVCSQGGDPARPAINAPTGAIFKICDAKLFVPIVTKNKYRSEMSNETKNNNLNCLIDPMFVKINRLFVLP